MIKQPQQPIQMLKSGQARKKPAHQHTINASHELQIMQNISVDQLKDLEQTYTFMLAAVKEARISKQKADKQRAEILKHGTARTIINRRRDLKIAWLWEHGFKSKEIDKRMGCKIGYSLNRVLASHGRALKRGLILEAKKRFVIASVNAGAGTRPTARLVPAALGACSPALVCKIMKAEKMRQQTPLPLPLFSVK